MNQQEFTAYWETEYPEAYPISHELKKVYPNRWFRIHNLPNSKRYAESREEYQIIFDRQNQLINDLIGERTAYIISFGLYKLDTTNDNYEKLIDFKDFNKIQTINLQEARPEQYEDETYIDIYVKQDVWRKDSKNIILKAIADDEIRAMFICPTKKCIIAPYDGGVDIIVGATEKRDELKMKYKNWLSRREDGM